MCIPRQRDSNKMVTEISDRVRGQFEALYRRRAEVVVAAPGRVNFIGEHVDYNGGWVLPAAIDRCLAMAVAPRADGRIRVASANFQGTFEFRREDIAPGCATNWSRYVLGVVAGLSRAGHRVPGFDACVASEIPVGGGLSSSAALEAATGIAVMALVGEKVDRFGLATLCQRAEHEFAGVPCGIMDQAAVLCCEQGNLLLLDCQSNQFSQVPLPAVDWSLVVIDSGVSHELASGEYARRRAACEQAAGILGVPSLRHVAEGELEDALGSPTLSDEMRRCVRHVVTENARTLECVAALRAGDFPAAGRLLGASHASLRDDYRVSCDELDGIVDIAQHLAPVAGCRMTGGGFGGSCIALVRRAEAAAVMREVGERFRARFGRYPKSFATAASAGARLIAP